MYVCRIVAFISGFIEQTDCAREEADLLIFT